MPNLATIRRSSRAKKTQHESDDTHQTDQKNPARRIPMSEDTTKYPKTGRRGAPQVFPRKLYEILTDEQDSVSWSKNGKSFTICDMDTFSNDVLLNYFRHQKYSSFQRQLNL